MFSKPGSSKGSRLRANARPDSNINIKPLTLYGWEGAPYVTPVRELLCELSIPHVFVNCATGSANRYTCQQWLYYLYISLAYPNYDEIDRYIFCVIFGFCREKLAARTKGVFQVPYIVDPNTGIEMFESASILKYLEEVYTV